MHESVEVPEPAMLAGDKLHDSPAKGETERDKLTIPVKPFTEATVTVDVPVPPVFRATVLGLALMLKSVTA